jgi:hypothetical protein
VCRASVAKPIPAVHQTNYEEFLHPSLKIEKTEIVFHGELSTNMKNIIVLLFFAVMTSLALARSQYPRPLTIKNVGENLVACLPEDDGEDIELKAAFVGQEGATAETGVNWRIEIKPGAKPLVMHPGDCLAYGSNIDGYTYSFSQESLQINVPYTFSIRRGNAGKKWLTNLHNEMFCALNVNGLIVFKKYIQKGSSAPPDICAYVKSQLPD